MSLGVLKAILDNEIPIDAVGGTSAGSALAVCYALNLSYTKTAEAYRQLTDNVRKSLKWHQFTLPVISLISGKYTTTSLFHIFGDVKIEDLWLPYFSISSNLSQGKEVIDRTGLMRDAVRATGALPGVVPPLIVNGEMFYDGGLMNNLPVDRMRKLLGDDALIFAVSLTNKGSHYQTYNFPLVIPFYIPLLKKLRLGYKEVTFPPFFNTFIQALLIGASAKESANQAKADILIFPDLGMFRSFDFNEKYYIQMMEVGYAAALEKLNQIEKIRK